MLKYLQESGNGFLSALVLPADMSTHFLICCHKISTGTEYSRDVIVNSSLPEIRISFLIGLIIFFTV